MTTSLTSAVAVALLSASACSPSGTGPSEELTAARSRWARQGPASYSITIRRLCECLPGTSGPVVVSVRNGAVESRTYLQSGAAVPGEHAEVFPTIEGLFAIIAGAERNDTRPLVVHYNTTLGYPTRIELGDPAVDAPVYLVSDFSLR